MFEDIDVDLLLPVTVLKAQLCSLTGVPPERQKLLGLKGGPLKDDCDLNSVGLKDVRNKAKRKREKDSRETIISDENRFLMSDYC